MDSPIRRSRAESGFTLVEILVVIVLIALLSLWGYPSLIGTLHRLKLTNTARQAAVFVQIARMEAVKRSLPTAVTYQTAAQSDLGVPSLIAWVDLDSDGIFDPIDTNPLTDDDKVLSGPYPLPNGIDLWGPGDATKEGAKSIDGWDLPGGVKPGVFFFSNGEADEIGAFRFRDQNGNILESRVAFLGTGKVVIQKYFPSPIDAFYENGEAGNIWKWWS